MLYRIEILQADFDYFFRSEIKEFLKEAENDLELAEELLTDAWVERILEEGRYNARDIEEIL